MRSQIEQQIKKLGIILPSPPAPVAAYVPYTISGNLVFISGQVCFLDGDNSLRGKLGKDLSLDQGYVAARNCALNAIAHLKSACKGDLDIVSRCISIRVFIACSPDFSEHPKVGDGASDLISEIFGPDGLHTRAAIGCTSLPLNCAVEVESIWEIK